MGKLKISRIEVRKLFGVYNYDLQYASNEVSFDNLMILYGDNGTGKSTILRMINYLLSNKERNGHKSELANIAFESFLISFTDGSFIKAYRDNNAYNWQGKYSISYSIKGKTDTFTLLAVREDEKWSIRFRNSQTEKKYFLLLELLKDEEILFISDRRKEINGVGHTSIEEIETFNSRMRIRRIEKREEVEREIRLLQEWLINRALSASKKGEEGTSNIYAKLIEQLSVNNSVGENEKSLEDIKKELEIIAEKAKPYVDMGFLNETDYKYLLQNIDKTQKSKISVVQAILTPYIETLNNKMMALNDLMEILSYMLESLSSYLHEKTISFSVSDGFSIRHVKNGEQVSFECLSSGEKQLLILFSKVIRNSSKCSFIIIDEPEISLNIKWQRMLMNTLNFFVSDNHAQFIIATHSFEILSKHMGNVVQLRDIE